jgi:DnaJ-class molecular chaperone
METNKKKIDEFEEYMCRPFEEEMETYFKLFPKRGIIICQFCKGTGMSIEMACSRCNGKGEFRFQKSQQ